MAPQQLVTGDGFRFRVPASWSVVGGKTGAKASAGDQFVRVATFPLARAYSPALFTKVATELAARMDAVAKDSGGVVTEHHVVTVDGAKSHEYDVKVNGKTLRYTFVLRGKREFLLLCSAADAVCRELAASFSAG